VSEVATVREDLVPMVVRVEDVRQETPDIRSIRLALASGDGTECAEGAKVAACAEGKPFEFRPGQFCLVSVFGAGEAAFCIASPPAWRDAIEISVKNVGKVTSAVHDLEVGDTVGLRGPYGNWFPADKMAGRNVVIVGGGIGLAPLRPLVWQVLSERDKFKDVYIIYGARTVNDLVYKNELADWAAQPGIRLVRAVDPGGEDATWDGEVGLVPAILEKVAPPTDSVLVTCGPPIMIKFVIVSATKMGFSPKDIVTTLEMKMKCGVGLCGRCNIGSRYVCKDGPVFTLNQIQALPDEF
jgi:sulfhydrogenase subunit gamma (sulfur reductase)